MFPILDPAIEPVTFGTYTRAKFKKACETGSMPRHEHCMPILDDNNDAMREDDVDDDVSILQHIHTPTHRRWW